MISYYCNKFSDVLSKAQAHKEGYMSISSDQSSLQSNPQIFFIDESEFYIQQPLESSQEKKMTPTVGLFSVSVAEKKDIKHDKFHSYIHEHVFKFLHPYVTGQINAENESPDRLTIIESLFKKLPAEAIHHKDEIREIAFHAYIKAACYGLYVNRKVSKGIITAYSAEFNILLDALQKGISKDFPDKKLSETEIEAYALGGLIDVNAEKKQTEQDLAHKTHEITYERVLKMNTLKQEGILFLNKPSSASSMLSSKIKQLEQDLVALLDNITLEKLSAVKAQLAEIESLLDINAATLPEQKHLSKKVELWNDIYLFLNKSISMKSNRFGNHQYDVELIQEDLHEKYKYYLEHNQEDPYFCLFVNNILKTFQLIEKITDFQDKLKLLNLANSELCQLLESIQNTQWYNIVYSSPYDDQETIQDMTDKATKCFDAMIEGCSQLQLLPTSVLSVDTVAKFLMCCLDGQKSPSDIQDFFKQQQPHANATE